MVTFNNFIKSESDRIKEKLNKLENQNIKFSQKLSKFGLAKYNSIQPKYILNVNENNWLKNKHNSCRYDAFITMYLFSIIINLILLIKIY